MSTRPILYEIKQSESRLQKLSELKWELELPTSAPEKAVAEPADKLDRILKQIEELRREVRELRDDKK